MTVIIILLNLAPLFFSLLVFRVSIPLGLFIMLFSVINIDTAYRIRKHPQTALPWRKTRIALNILVNLSSGFFIASDRASAVYIGYFLIILTACTLVMLFLSKKKDKAPEVLQGGEGDYSEDLSRYKQDVLDILENKYYLRSEGLENLVEGFMAVIASHAYKKPILLTTFWREFKKYNKTPEKTAAFLHGYMIEAFQGQPENVFDLNRMPLRKKIKISNSVWKLMLWGRLYLAPKQKQILVFMWLFTGLMLYGFGVVILGPAADVFIPNAAFTNIIYGLTAVLSLLAAIWFFMIPPWHNHTPHSHKRQPNIFLKLLLFPLVFFLVYIALVPGFGELYTEIFGKSATKILIAEKDEDTTRTRHIGRYSRGTINAYCIINDELTEPFFINGYCIRKEHYDQLPDGEFLFKLSVKQSILGYVITGYYMPKRP